MSYTPTPDDLGRDIRRLERRLAILENVNPAQVGQTATGLTVNGGVTATGSITAGGTLTGSAGLVVGTGTTLTQIAVYAPSLTPASVAANTSAEQTFTVSGLATSDKVVVNGPAPTAGCPLVHARASGLNTLALTFLNTTAGPLTPAAGVHSVIAIRS
jgi:hypothetical protein